MLHRYYHAVGLCSFLFLEIVLFSSILYISNLVEQGKIPFLWGQNIIFWELLAIMMHWIVALNDPGVVCLPRQSYFVSNWKKNPRYCRVCQTLKTPSVHHCSKCQVCVMEMDHHCPIVCNCIGLGNRKQFVQLLVYGFFAFFWASVISFYLYLHDTSGTYPSYMLLFSTVKSAISASILLYLIVEQLCLISWEIGKLDALHMGFSIRAKGRKCFRRKPLLLFFGPSCWDWFWPF